MTEAEQIFGGIWTVKKLEAVECYLAAYTKVLKKQNFNLIYIDAFAGSGSWFPQQKEIAGQLSFLESKPIDGSVIRALKQDFNQYLFIEKDKNHAKKLKESISFSDKKNATIENDANKVLPLFCEHMKKNDRAVCFLDPYGGDVEWSTLKAIANTKKIDLWYLFPYSSIVRSTSRDQRDQTLHKLLDMTNSKSFMESNEDDRFYIIKQQLETIFPVVSKNYFSLKNRKSSTMFMLLFAVSSKSDKAQEIAIRIADHILKSS